MGAPPREVALGPAASLRRAARRAAPKSLLGWAPPLTLALFLGPIAVGLAATLLPAFGVLPALGGTEPSLGPLRAALAAPGVGTALLLSLTTGFAATALSLALALLLAAAWHGRPALDRARRLLAPVLALPHAALAIGLAFVLAPSGWLVRLAAGPLGLERPPDIALVGDPAGLALVAGLVVKETAFLLLAILAALGQCDADRAVRVARSLGYRPLAAWAKAVLPRLYPQIRLPVYAVLAFSLSVVDMALILGPATPPTFAVLVLRWFDDPDLALRFQAAAGAVLHLAVTAGAILAWRGGEAAAARLGRRFLSDGRRGGEGGAARGLAAAGAGAVAGLAALSALALALWSVARHWRFPAALPAGPTLANWQGAGGLAAPLLTTVATAGAATAIALGLSLACLEWERRAGLHPTARVLWLLYLPLIVPQIAFLFGVQIVLVLLGLDGGWTALIWIHALFVLPYVYLTLADPYRSLDPRYARAGACLGAGPWRVFWRITLPLLRRPVAAAAAVGVAVSTAEYLPTLFAGAGRLTTLATEAVARAGGGDRRAVAVAAFLQMLLPLLAFAAALALPERRGRGRAGG
ncbi:MAG TPA: ABC transporter permease subunit [Alphaproteobacteria bacterium]|nr:ABC transporter permease subunit [Alphaproteobacteria bacterium]